MKQKLRKLYELLWLAAPVVIWFSYYPNIHLGQDETMNFEISLPLILLALLALVSAPYVVRNWRKVFTQKFVWAVSALSVYSMASMFWSANPTRGLLTGGIIGLLYLVFLGAIANKDRLCKLLPRVAKVYVTSAVVMSGLALLQFVLGIWLPQSITLLCDGCVSAQFGFPRPNVFAIEPQFFANMLLPAILILAHRVMSRGVKWRLIDDSGHLGIMLLSLFLTMSRGAIYALVIGLMILAVIHITRLRRLAVFAGISALTLVASFTLQGAAAALSPKVSETFTGAVAKSINQLSMGVIDISQPEPEDETQQPQVEEGKEAPAFDGYVEESTDIRMGRTEMALETWGRDVPTMLFGVGLGGAGVAVQQQFPGQTGAREIVQNEYVERLLERGVIGLTLTLGAIGWLVYLLRSQKWLWSIIAALLFQYLLFSGYPNVTHVYLVLILVAAAGMSLKRRETN